MHPLEEGWKYHVKCVCTDPYNRYCQAERHFIYGELKPRFPGESNRSGSIAFIIAGTTQLACSPVTLWLRSNTYLNYRPPGYRVNVRRTLVSR